MKAFYPPPSGKAYHVGIWERGIDKVMVGSEGKWLKRSRTLPSNPCDVTITTFDDKFTVYINNEKFYEENWRFKDKKCEIRIYAMSWYLNGAGWCWIDDVFVCAGRFIEREIPW